MLSILLLLAAADDSAKLVCQPNRLQPVGGAPKAGPHKLGDEPPARQIYTVMRSENGCSTPVPVSDRVIGARNR